MKVYIDVLGQDVKTKEVVSGTVQTIADEFGYSAGYTASINAEPVDYSTELSHMDIVSFTKAVKGGATLTAKAKPKSKKKAKKAAKKQPIKQ